MTDDEDREWCDASRARVAEYLRSEGVDHGRIGEGPAWHVAPCVSLWAIESKARQGAIGWWAICGDLPTDYVSSSGLRHPREALRAIATSWLSQASLMARGETGCNTIIGTPESWPSLAPLL